MHPSDDFFLSTYQFLDVKLAIAQLIILNSERYLSEMDKRSSKFMLLWTVVTK